MKVGKLKAGNPLNLFWTFSIGNLHAKGSAHRSKDRQGAL